MNIGEGTELLIQMKLIQHWVLDVEVIWYDISCNKKIKWKLFSDELTMGYKEIREGKDNIYKKKKKPENEQSKRVVCVDLEMSSRKIDQGNMSKIVVNV